MTDSNQLYFTEDILGYDFTSYPDNVVHILCVAGNMSFRSQHIRFNVAVGDYVILPPGMSASDFLMSDDCQLLLMSFDESLADRCMIQSDYGVIGHISLLQNPVMRLDEKDFDRCVTDILRLKERCTSTGHLFYEEMVSALLKAHILDLYDIHARNNSHVDISSRPAALMRDFIGMLVAGDYKTDRSMDYYASRLCITPHYLTEICNKLTHHPASYWIDSFVVKATCRLLMHKHITLDEIAWQMNFSSVSHLTRYAKRHLGMTPSAFRKSLDL